MKYHIDQKEFFKKKINQQKDDIERMNKEIQKDRNGKGNKNKKAIQGRYK